MRLILLFSALLAALTGVSVGARAAEAPAVEQRAAAASEAAVAVVATLGATAHVSPDAAAPTTRLVPVIAARPELYRDRRRE